MRVLCARVEERVLSSKRAISIQFDFLFLFLSHFGRTSIALPVGKVAQAKCTAVFVFVVVVVVVVTLLLLVMS